MKAIRGTDLSHEGKGNTVNECPATPAVQDTTGEAHFFHFMQHPEYEGRPSQTRGREEIRKEADKTIKDMEGIWFLLTAFRAPAGSPPRDTEKTSFKDVPAWLKALPEP